MRKIRRAQSKHKREIIIPAVCTVVEAVAFVAAGKFQECDRVGLYENIDNRISSIDCRVIKCGGTGLWQIVLMIYRGLTSGTVDVGYTLLAFATITAATVIMFYSLIDAKNFGIPHRTIMYYCIGSYTLPVEFLFLIINIIVVYIASSNGLNAFATVITIYGILQQFIIIGMVMLSTSCGFNIMMISCEERWQYKEKKKKRGRDAEFYSVYVTSHAKHAMDCEDLFSDRVNLVRNLMDVPILYIKRYYKKEFKRDKWEWQCEYIFAYYYEQMTGVFSVLSKDKNDIDKIYQVIYEFVSWMKNDMHLKAIIVDSRYKTQYEDLMNFVCGAFIYAAYTECTPERDGFLIYIVKKILNEEECRKQVIFIYFMIEFMDFTENRNKLWDDINVFRKIPGYDISEADKLYCDRCWRLLSNTTSVDEKKAKKQYNNAINTFMNCGGKSKIAKRIKIIQDCGDM